MFLWGNPLFREAFTNTLLFTCVLLSPNRSFIFGRITMFIFLPGHGEAIPAHVDISPYSYVKFTLNS